ncbi:MAG: hypothetical protein EOM76_02590 [Sphingobacteriia bacterium]|jgi:hypothetical protein|nr:hypothetical protein [Paludibacteraceae bacterium]NCA79065.1 hypothetical protein [Sphingobacteriia bacterium]
MAQGITFTSDAKVTIDLKKYGSKLMDFFISEGVEDKATKILCKPNAKTRRVIRNEKLGIGVLSYKSKDDLFKSWE